MRLCYDKKYLQQNHDSILSIIHAKCDFTVTEECNMILARR